MVHIIFHSIPFHFSSQEIGNFDFRSCSPLSTCFARSADQSDVVGDSGWAWMNLRSCGSDFEQVTKSQQSIWFFPECVARVPVSLRGSGGWGCVPSTLRLCSQPSQPSARAPYGRAYGKFCKRGHFWILVEVAHVALLRFAWHAWHFVTSRRVL